MGEAEISEFLPRRRPLQERSRRRFDEILQAARALLVEVGFEAFTADQVALRAGVPIGSLYQFFGNKYAIICELDRIDTANIRKELESFAAEIPSLD
ncbi:MAG TPA: helix-turn-helix domain-containing protein, partial [Marmoricola sp.]|nr:helix-turn-helix domain-containing protein [Marmoricola sp.]